MLEKQLLRRVDPCGNRDDLQLIRMGGPYVCGGIADDAYGGSAAGSLPRLFDRAAKDIFAVFVVVAEPAEVEVVEQAATLQFQFSDRFEVSGSYSEHCAAPMQMCKHVLYAGQDSRPKLALLPLYKRAHPFPQGCQLRSPVLVFNLRARKGITQNADVCVAMRDDAVQVERSSGGCAESIAKSEVMNRIGAVQQGAIDIKQVRVESIPGAA